MPTVVSHFLVAAGVFRFVEGPREKPNAGWAVAGALAMLPDADTALMRWVERGSMWSHRGFTHSFAFAIVVALVAAQAMRRRVAVPGGFAGLWATLAVTTATHGLLDTLTDGGSGIALLWPIDTARVRAGVQPIPVAPITVNPLVTRVWTVMAVEALLLWPAALALATARRPMAGALRQLVLLTLAVSAAAWAFRCGA
jgi:inner membrane protein